MAEGAESEGPARIALLPSGTRGDAQPYIALGLALRRAGYVVVAFTDEGAESDFKEWGLDTVVARYDLKKRAGGRAALEKAMQTGSMFAAVEAATEEEGEEAAKDGKEEFEWLKYLLTEFKPSMMVINSVSMAEGRKLEMVLKIPLVEVHFSPQHMPTEEFAPCHSIELVPDLEPGTPVGALWAIGVQNSARQALDQEAQLLTRAGPDDIFAHLILSGEVRTPEQISDSWFKVEDAPLPVVFAHSPHFWAPPAEWNPKCMKVLGNWKICKEDQIGHTKDGCSFFGSQEDHERCKAFLAAGEPPVYVGWGSMTVKHPLTLSYLAVKAVKLAGRRGILVKGWSDLTLDDVREQPDAEEVRAWADDNIFIMKSAPHEWLMRQCVCAVHHGGCGTCQASLSCGIPAVVTPVLLDQYSNGAHLQEAKIGAVASRLASTTPEELSEKIRKCCTDEEIKANCAKARDLMAEENGAENMVKFIGECLQDIASGKWQARYYERIMDQEARRKKRLGKPAEVVVAQLDKQAKQALPEYKKWADSQSKQFMEMNDAIKSESLFYVKASTGVVAREGEGLKTPESGRFKENALLLKLEQKGNRMNVRRLRGHGPAEGWVSTSVSGKDVLGKIGDMTELRPIQEALFAKQFGRAAYVT